MAFRMQTSVPELIDCRERAASTSRAVRPRRRASPARSRRNCLLARRLAERGVRFVQLYHRGWDHHGEPARLHPRQHAATPTSRPRRLITDLKQRGLLDDTLVIWGGEFGRTSTRRASSRRRLRPRPSSALLHHVDGGRRREAAASRYGETDDFGFNVVEGPGARARPARDDAAPARHRPRRS